MIKKSDIRGFSKSFSYSMKGILYCIKNERNMRVHLCMVVLVSIFSAFYKVTKMEYIMILLCFVAVIGNEAINTAIETVINLESPSYNNLARIAKDVAAGAVFISAIISAIIGAIIFLDLDRLLLAIKVIITNPWHIGMMLLLIVISVLFVFNGYQIFGESKTKVYHIRTKK